MDTKDLLSILRHRNPWWEGGEPDGGHPRVELGEIAPWVGRDLVVALCGMRRVGKTWILRQIVLDQMHKGKPANEILFVDFEEHGFAGELTDPTFPTRLFQAYREALKPEGTPLLLLDEVQNLPSWAPWARTISETEQARCVVTGSSSQVIEPDLARVLTGRYLSFTVHPLAFADFLTFRRYAPFDGPLRAPSMPEALADFLRFGGLPRASIERTDEARERILSETFAQILGNDVIGRHGIRVSDSVKQLALHCLRHTGTLIAFNRLKETLRLSMDQVRSWLDYLADARLVYLVKRLHPKVAVVERSGRKVYAGDLGLRHAATLRFSADLGHLAETAVFLSLCRNRRAEVRYFAEKRECDFVVWQQDRAVAAVQVWYGDPGSPLPERERAGLLEAMLAHGLTEGTLVTRDVAARDTEAGLTIEQVPLHEWLLRAVP